ncbi:MAG: Ca2+-binding RTX toxin-like protein [Celeribacter sp.]|jgi:Ca2+-binding RTX toxin-like protein
MTLITIYGSNSSDTFNPSIFGSGYTSYRIYGNGGDDVITVDTPIPTVINGGEGNDTIHLYTANDIAHGDNGDDTINGGGGSDTIYGDAGNDILNGENGDDFIFGGAGNDILNGGAGNDLLSGGKGHDVIFGGIGDDTIYGNKGNNTLSGGDGNDYINTGDHTSTVDGGTGDDLINARLKKGGDHVLTGGEGADTFEFVFQSAKKSADVIVTDFDLGVDQFVIGDVLGQEWVDAAFAFGAAFGVDILTEVDGNAVLDIGFNDTITFEGISEEDFLTYYAPDDALIAV